MKKYIFATIDNADFVYEKNDISIKCKAFEEDFSALPLFSEFSTYDKESICIKSDYDEDGFRKKRFINISDFPNYKAIYNENKIKFRPCSVLSFDDVIVLDEEGDYYLLTLTDVDEGGCGPADAVEPYYFIVKLNVEQVNIINNKTDVVADFINNKNNNALEDLYCFLSFLSEDFFEKMNLIDEEFIGKVYVYLNKLN